MDFANTLGKISLEKYRKDDEFAGELEATPDFRIEGFDFVANERKEINLLQGEYRSASTQRQLEIRNRLTTLREETPPLDEEQMRVFLKDILDNLHSPDLKKFVEKNCIIKLTKGKDGGATIDSSFGKFVIGLNANSFYDYGRTQIVDEFGITKKLRIFSPVKVARLIGQALGHILQEPDNWKEHAPKIAIMENRVGSWQDFVSFCLTNPDRAEKLFPQGYVFLRSILEGINKVKIEVKPQKTHKIDDQDFNVDLRSDQEKARGEDKDSGFFKKFIKNFTKKLGYLSVDRLMVGIYKMSGKAPDDATGINWDIIKDRLWKRTDWYQRAVAELEDKEVSRIMTRNEGIADRDRSLRQFMNDGASNICWEDQFMVRSIVLADMKFQDWSAERMHFVLQATDNLYRETHGEEISEEGYNFVVRCHRVSNTGKRHGTKPPEYKLVMVGDEYLTYDQEKRMMVKKMAHKRRYLRKDREEWQNDMLWEVGTKTNRDIGNTAQEVFEYMKIEGGRFIEPDEVWGAGSKYNKLDEENKFASATGDIRNFVGPEAAERIIDNINHRQKAPKLNPDQIAIMARTIAEELKSENASQLGIKAERRIMGGEHVKAIALDAYKYYRVKFLADAKLRNYINYYIRPLGYETDAEGKMHRVPGLENTDEDRLKRFTTQEYAKNPEYQKAHEVLEKYGEMGQSEAEEPKLWEKDGDKTRDVSDNELRKNFIFNRSAADVAKDTSNTDRAIKHYQEFIGKKVGTSRLDLSAKKALLNLLLHDPEHRQKEFVRDVALDVLMENSPESFSNPDKELETKRILTNLVYEIRPQRREMFKLMRLQQKLGIKLQTTTDYVEKVKKIMIDTSDEQKKTDLDEIAKHSNAPEIERFEKAELIKLKIIDENGKENKKIKDYNDKRWLEIKIAGRISALINDIQNGKFTDEEIEQELSDMKIIPEGEIIRYKDPQGKIHRNRLIEVLQIAQTAVEYQCLSIKIKLTPKEEKEKEEKKK